MKGFLAVILAFAPKLRAANLKTPIHLALSCDEEVGCKGVRPLVAHIRDHMKKPKLVIVGEPTSMQVVNAHKSAMTFSTEVLGHEAHSSLTDQGVNAIMIAGELLGEINRIREDLKKWRKMEIEPLLNMSVNETLSRTIVTSLSLILTLTILLVLGPEVSFGFTAAMLLGIVIGTFSSIYVSAPILIWLKVGSNSFVPTAAIGVNERNAKPEGFIK